MKDYIVAIFPNVDEASSFQYYLGLCWLIDDVKMLSLANSLTKQDVDVWIDHYIEDNINQGASIIYCSVTNDQWISVRELISSYGGEVYERNTDFEVMNKMYNIPEESFEQETQESGIFHEKGTLGYPFDQLDDNAFIDPNIGIGNYDLLIPFMDQVSDEVSDDEVNDS